MDEWLTRARDGFAEAAGIPATELELTPHSVVTLLDLAALAANESGERTNAPLLCYLLGKAERGAASTRSPPPCARQDDGSSLSASKSSEKP